MTKAIQFMKPVDSFEFCVGDESVTYYVYEDDLDRAAERIIKEHDMAKALSDLNDLLSITDEDYAMLEKMLETELEEWKNMIHARLRMFQEELVLEKAQDIILYEERL